MGLEEWKEPELRECPPPICPKPATLEGSSPGLQPPRLERSLVGPKALGPGGRSLGGSKPDRRFLPALTQTAGSLAVWSFLFLDLETLRGGGGVSSSF